MSTEGFRNSYEEATHFDDVTTHFDDLTAKFDDITTFDGDIAGNFTTPISHFHPDYLRLMVYKINLILAAVLTSFGMLNLFFLWCLLKFCPVIKTFNMYAVMICIADLINNLVIGPMYLIAWVNISYLTEHFCKVS